MQASRVSYASHCDDGKPALRLSIALGACMCLLLCGLVWIRIQAGFHGLPIVIVFVCALASSIAGVAFPAIVALPLMCIIPDRLEAIQIALVGSIAIQSYSVCVLWRHIVFARIMQSVAGGVLCLPIGIELLLTTPIWITRLLLGLCLLQYCLLPRVLTRRVQLPDNSMVRFLVGGLGGLTGPLAAFPGAFPTIWISMTGLEKFAQRAFYQPYILLMQLATLTALTTVAPINFKLQDCYAFILPAIFGAHIGISIFKRLTNAQFSGAQRTLLLLSAFGLISGALF